MVRILICVFFFFFQAEDGIRDAQESRGLGDVYKRQVMVVDCDKQQRQFCLISPTIQFVVFAGWSALMIAWIRSRMSRRRRRGDDPMLVRYYNDVLLLLMTWCIAKSVEQLIYISTTVPITSGYEGGAYKVEQFLFGIGDAFVPFFVVLFLSLPYPARKQVKRLNLISLAMASGSAFYRSYLDWPPMARQLCEFMSFYKARASMVDDVVLIVVCAVALIIASRRSTDRFDGYLRQFTGDSQNQPDMVHSDHCLPNSMSEPHCALLSMQRQTSRALEEPKRPLNPLAYFLILWASCDLISIAILCAVDGTILINRVIATVFYLLFPGVVYWVLKTDSRYWLYHARLLLQAANDLDESAARLPSESLHQLEDKLVSSQWEELEPLGAGTEAVVYKVLLEGKLVAGKKWELFSGAPRDACMAAVREAALMSAVDHPNVVKLEGLCVDPPEVCLFLEFCGQGDMHAYLVRNPGMSHIFRLALAAQVASGMQAIHDSGLCHRDLKTLNVLVDDNLDAKVTDFGMARLRTRRMSANIGSMAYMAPEIKLDRVGLEETYTDYDGEASDVYAFGFVLWESMASVSLPSHQRMDPRQRPSRDPVPQEMVACPEMVEVSCKGLITSCWANDASLRPEFESLHCQLCQLLELCQDHWDCGRIRERAGFGFLDKRPSLPHQYTPCSSVNRLTH
eukprot:TRINITY_DN14210_c0_g1_i1.p1 TRINITY_DN14210_c0_g1~~TRINITY_DN14210_c0_g1_i1.p1  ORF type:complete len:681 (+),score=137.04 TRINITY_DN14210_c0_g1_i1:74-2116(+)